MPHEYPRSIRVADRIHRELGELLAREFKDPRLPSLVTVAHVAVNRDLSLAKVSITSLDKQSTLNAVKVLQRAAGFLRRQLAQRLSMRYVPQLRFETDGAGYQAARIEALLAGNHESESH